MARPVILSSGIWSDLPLEELAQKASEWGYQGLELCCWGDHFEVQRALSESGYCQKKLDLLSRHDLGLAAISNHRVGQAVCGRVDARHQAILPDYVWGDGKPEEVAQRAAEEMMATARAAEKMGASVVGGYTGSPLWAYVCSYPPASPVDFLAGFKEFARRWNPILDIYRDCGVKFAFEVEPGQIAFDLYTAEMALDAIGGREDLGFLFDPTHLYWQGIDPTQFLRRFPDRIYHVHVRDAVMTLDGRSSVLGSYLPEGDPRRGWHNRSPGHGGIDWEAIVRTLNHIGYDGSLGVDWRDPDMHRDYGAEDACKFVRRLDFKGASGVVGNQPFQDA